MLYSSQKSLQSTHLMVLLFCLKPQGFSQDKEQDFCPDSKPWGLVPQGLDLQANILWGLDLRTRPPSQHTLQPPVTLHPAPSFPSLSQANGCCHRAFASAFLPRMLFTAHLLSNNSYSLLGPQLHITLQGNWPPIPLRSPDYIFIRDHVILHDIAERSHNSTTLILWLLVQSLSPVNSCLL